MEDCKLCILVTFFLIITKVVVTGKDIPTTLEGPFDPVTIRFDPSLRQGSDDIPMDDPRLKKNVTSMFPEQIALALSTPTSMWVSWVTGTFLCGSFCFFFYLFCVLVLVVDMCGRFVRFRGCTDWFQCDYA